MRLPDTRDSSIREVSSVDSSAYREFMASIAWPRRTPSRRPGEVRDPWRAAAVAGEGEDHPRPHRPVGRYVAPCQVVLRAHLARLLQRAGPVLAEQRALGLPLPGAGRPDTVAGGE